MRELKKQYSDIITFIKIFGIPHIQGYELLNFQYFSP